MLALVSFTSTVYPSLIGTWPPSLLFLSKHVDARTHTHTCTHALTRSDIHPRAHIHMKLWEHLEELIQCTDKRFLESTKRTIRAASNSPPLLTQTRVHAHTPLGCWGKRQIRWAERTKNVSLHLVLLQHLRLTRRAQGLAFFSASVSSTHLHICRPVRVRGPPGHRENQGARGATCETVWVCRGQAFWLRTCPYNASEKG